MPSSPKPTITLIDGRSGAGKSHYATGLARTSGAQVVSLDEVYPGWDGLDAGSWHIYTHVVLPISQGLPARYQRWDWTTHSPGSWVTVAENTNLILEGCGAIRREMLPFASSSIYLEAPEELRHERALHRDGNSYEAHWQRWALQEQRFLDIHHSNRIAEVVEKTWGE
jgi:uridine kinase